MLGWRHETELRGSSGHVLEAMKAMLRCCGRPLAVAPRGGLKRPQTLDTDPGLAAERRGSRAVVACSALKRAYRDVLLQEGAGGDPRKLLFVRSGPAATPRHPCTCTAQAGRHLSAGMVP